MTLSRVAVVVVASALLLSACGSNSGSSGSGSGITSTSITIGTTSPLTGGVASACKPLTDGAAAWFAKVNREGGVNGRTIKNTVKDDVYEAPKALSNARGLANLPVFAFFGGCGTIQPPAVEGVAGPKKIPYLFPYTGIAGTLKASNVFGMLPTYADQLTALVKRSMQKYGPGSVYLLNVKIPGSEETEAAVKKATAQSGGKFLGSETTSPGQSDVTAPVLKAKAQKPDYLILGQTAQDASRMVIAMKSQNAFPAKRILGFSTLASKAFTGPSAGVADGRLDALSPVVPWNSADAKSCNDAFAASKTEVSPDGFSLFGCAMAQLFVDGLKAAGKDVTREKLIHSFETFSGKTVTPVLPPVTFTSKNHLGATSMVLVGFKGGGLVNEGLVSLR